MTKLTFLFALSRQQFRRWVPS